jgi:hypothetical protein
LSFPNSFASGPKNVPHFRTLSRSVNANCLIVLAFTKALSFDIL